MPDLRGFQNPVDIYTKKLMNAMKNDLPEIIVICGPTGIGKTSVAIELANDFNAEIISADSMQIYRQMDIGTAKPTDEEQAYVPHHLIDMIDPDESFDAGQFAEAASEKIYQFHQQGIVPFIVGGTGLYIKTLVHGICQEIPTDIALRKHLKQVAAEKGSESLYIQLCETDPDSARKIHPNDTYRIIRALEVFETTGKPISQHHQNHQFAEKRFRTLKIGLHTNRERLYERIDRRVDAMIAEGLKEEVKKLLNMGYSPDLKAMQSIGYRHIADFLQSRLSWDEAVRTLKRDTRRYAKRQMVWFRADPEIIWKEPEQSDEIRELIKDFLS